MCREEQLRFSWGRKVPVISGDGYLIIIMHVKAEIEMSLRVFQIINMLSCLQFKTSCQVNFCRNQFPDYQRLIWRSLATVYLYFCPLILLMSCFLSRARCNFEAHLGSIFMMIDLWLSTLICSLFHELCRLSPWILIYLSSKHSISYTSRQISSACKSLKSIRSMRDKEGVYADISFVVHVLLASSVVCFY